MAAAYSDDIGRVTQEHAGIPVNIFLRERTDLLPVPFYCLSWRTRYPGSTQNRRFYSLRDRGFWTIPVSIALSLLEEAEDEGLLDEQYDDPQIRHHGINNTVIDSRVLGGTERRSIFDSITADYGELDWGHEPIFKIVQVPDETWRKIMIVDSKREICTFRSTTTDRSYGQKIILPRSHWILDNAMQDASAEMMRMFLSVLREI